MKPYLKTSLCVLFVLATCQAVWAQSGRRAPKPLSPPTSTAPPQAEPTPTPVQKKSLLNQQTLIVGMDAAMEIPLYMSEAVWNGFSTQLDKVSSIMVNADRKMGRKEAVERAKKQTQSYVVFLQLGTSNVGGGLGQVSLDDMLISYVIFSPGTGKVKENGQVHVRSTRDVLSRRLPTSRTGEAQLKDAGREAADRVLALLHIGGTAVNR